MAHPEGTVGRVSTAAKFVLAIRRMTRDLHAGGFSGPASGLTRATLTAYWLRSTYDLESKTRRMLQALDTASPVLDPGTRELVFGSSLKLPQKTTPLPAYTPGEWSRLLAECRTVIGIAWKQYKAAVALAAAGTDPREGGWSDVNTAWLLTRMGAATRDAVADHLGLRAAEVTLLGGLADTRDALFPRLDTVIAYRLLLGAYTGIVPDGLDGLETSDVTWAGGQTALLSYVKGRTAAESATLSRRAGRLLRRWLEHSALLREHADPGMRDRFWLAQVRCTVTAPGFGDWQLRPWARGHGLRDDQGGPLPLHMHRIRTTYISERQHRGWSGRTTIDPNHSPQVEGDRYLEVATPAQRAAAEAIITEAQGDLLRRAQPPAVLDIEDVAVLAARMPELTRGLGGQAAAEMAGGERDVFTAACADQFAGLHGPAGKPCPARPWVCLLCPLAVFTPRHLPNLLRLKAFFARQFQQMPRGEFAAVFAVYADRLTSQILPRFPGSAIASAQQEIAGTDAEIPLRAEEITREARQ